MNRETEEFYRNNELCRTYMLLKQFYYYSKDPSSKFIRADGAQNLKAFFNQHPNMKFVMWLTDKEFDEFIEGAIKYLC
jgi:hypothetical protein